jgi:flagellar biosynthesis/type III secretory pathway protein FliH
VHLVKVIRLPHLLVSVELASTPPADPPMYRAKELEAARREGYQRGFEDASAVIETQLVEQRGEVAHLQQKTFQAIASHHDTLTQQLRATVPELTMEIVRRVLGGMEPDKEAVLEIVNEVLRGIAPGPEALEVCLSVRDLKLMESYEAGFRDRYPQIAFRADAELMAGDCVVTSRFGALDGRLTTKLRSVDRLLQ